MNIKTILPALCSLAVCSCQPFVDALANEARKSLPFGDYIASGVGNVCGDVADACMGVSALRKDELANKVIVFMGTLEKEGKNYQIRDAVSFQHGHVFRMNGDIGLDSISSLSYYERTGGATAIFKRQAGSLEGEKYTLTFTSSEGGTYTYENIVNGVLISKGAGTFEVNELAD